MKYDSSNEGVSRSDSFSTFLGLRVTVSISKGIRQGENDREELGA